MAGVAKVVVDAVADREFDYAVPPELLDTVGVGSRVEVPFGRRLALGYVVALMDRSEFPALKPIRAVVGRTPLLTEATLRLARWVADYYCASLAEALQTALPAPVRGRRAAFKTEFWVHLVEPLAPSVRLTRREREIVEYLGNIGESERSALLRALGMKASPLGTLLRKGVVAQTERVVDRSPVPHRTVLPTCPPPLSGEQAVALQRIHRALDGQGPRVVLLYGVTGSGKTEIYLQVMERVLREGAGSIVLVPEIALTPQTVDRFVARFGDQVAVLHSHLSSGSRHDEWHRVREGRARVVIGARSAVFAPVPRLGLVVVDEEHEPTYKQEEAPRYHARDVAVMRAHQEGAVVILGSATPSLESWRNAATGKYAVATLRARVDGCRLPVIRVIDMRIETERRGRGSVFSEELVTALRLRLDRGEQSMLFLNRRGYATSLLCPRCGFVSQCRQCSVAHTYHRTDERLRCHVCGGSAAVPHRCPGCGDPAFRLAGLGTQRVEAVLRRLFPQAAIARMDSDSMTAREAYDRTLAAFRCGKTQILIGTQMIAKGLHFPNVTLVGVIHADLSLHVPDFRAAERTFQLLAQVAGRAGRGELPGEVLIQTYTPHHPAIQSVLRLDYEGFAEAELAARRDLLYPPFARLACLTLKGRSDRRVEFFARALRAGLRKHAPAGLRIAEPCPAPLFRAKGYYRFQILLRGISARRLRECIHRALAEVRFPSDVRCTVDIDALNLV